MPYPPRQTRPQRHGRKCHRRSGSSTLLEEWRGRIDELLVQADLASKDVVRIRPGQGGRPPRTPSWPPSDRLGQIPKDAGCQPRLGPGRHRKARRRHPRGLSVGRSGVRSKRGRKADSRRRGSRRSRRRLRPRGADEHPGDRPVNPMYAQLLEDGPHRRGASMPADGPPASQGPLAELHPPPSRHGATLPARASPGLGAPGRGRSARLRRRTGAAGAQAGHPRAASSRFDVPEQGRARLEQALSPRGRRSAGAPPTVDPAAETA